MFFEHLRRVIFLEIILFILLTIDDLLFVYTQNFLFLIPSIFDIFGIAYGFAYLYYEYHNR